MPFDSKALASKTARALAVVLPFVVMLPLMGWLAWEKAELKNSGIQNNDEHAMFDYDQHSYMNMGRLMRLEDYTRVVPRHRMPGFPFILSLFFSEADAYPVDATGADPRGVSEGYFARAKVFTIVLGCVSIVALFALCRFFLPIWESHLIAWSYGWLVASIRLPYVQPEVAFYVLFLLALVLLWQLLARPGWWLLAGAVLTLAVVYIVKSSVVPLIMLFLACAGLQAAGRLWFWLRGGRRDRELLKTTIRGLAMAALVPIGFGAVLFPYFKNTADLYGSPLWDVHSRHYLWMDTDEEKRFWRKAGISDPGFVPPEGREVPTAATYFRDHSWAEMGQRLKKGWFDIQAMTKARYRGAHSLLKKWVLPVALVLGVIFHRRVWDGLLSRPVEWLMVLGFFPGFTTLYCWYQAIGVGPRLALALWLPALFFAMLGIHRLTQELSFSLRGRKIPVRAAFNAATLFLIALHTALLLRGDFWTVEGGR